MAVARVREKRDCVEREREIDTYIEREREREGPGGQVRQCLCTKAWTASVYFIHRRDPGEVVRCRSLACPSMPPQGISGRNLITTEVASGTPILRRYSFPTSGDTASGGNDITARYSESPPPFPSECRSRSGAVYSTSW